MKKKLLTLFALSLLSVSGHAQGFYFRLGFGYAIPQAGQSITGTGTPYNGTLSGGSIIDQYSLKSASFSAGFNGTLALGYLFSDHIGAQLELDAGIAPKKFTFTGTNVNITYTNAGTILSNISITTRAVMPLILTPALVLQTGGKKVNVYSRFGPAIPLSSKMREEAVYQNVPGTGATSRNQYTYEIKNSFSLGLSAALGTQFKLNKRVNLWTEISLLSMSLYIKQSDLVAYAHNGRSYSISALSGTTTTYYSKKATTDSNSVNRPAYTQPFSNVGLKVGINIALGNRSKRGTASNDMIDKPQMSTRPKSGKFR